MSYPPRGPTALEHRIDPGRELLERRGIDLDRGDPDTRRDPRAAAFHKAARAESTNTKYHRWIGDFLDFCGRDGRKEVPASASTMEAFAIDLTRRKVTRGKNKGRVGYAPNAIRQALSAVRTFHRVQGQPLPDLGLANGILEGYARGRAKEPGNTDGQGVPGLRLPTLRELFAVCDPAMNAGARDRALLALGWAIMARRSELAGLSVDHVGRPSKRGLWVMIARSKTDQLGEGRRVFVPWMPDLEEMCPVTNVVRWQECLGAVGVTGGGFLRGVDRGDHINGGGGPYGGIVSEWMDPQTVELAIARAAIRAAVPDAAKYKAHSLRRGGASDMYAAGADILAIARQGRWGDRSPVIFRYIDDEVTQKRNALRIGNFRPVLLDDDGDEDDPVGGGA